MRIVSAVVGLVLLLPAQLLPQTSPWKVVTARPVPGAPRVLLMYDMEGLSGVSNGRMVVADYPEYARGRERLISDVNAVVAGLLAGGARSVTVQDFHGSGNTDGPDLPVNRLHPGARYVDPSLLPQNRRLEELGLWDVLVLVGMHEATGVFGFLSHTGSPGLDPRFNGQSLTETERIALRWGTSGIPVIFVSGDDQLALHMRRVLPWSTYVETKRAIRYDSAAVHDERVVEEALRTGAMEAVRRVAEARAITLEGPIRASLRAMQPADLSSLRGVPGVDYSDQTVSFDARDVLEAFAGLAALARVAVLGYNGAAFEAVKGLPNGETLSAQAWLKGVWEAAGSNQLRRRY